MRYPASEKLEIIRIVESARWTSSASPVERSTAGMIATAKCLSCLEKDVTRQLPKNRTLAAERQRWLCCYCGLPMTGKGSPFRASEQWCEVTAEHLVAQQDGGGDNSENIAAAHRLCNGQRHNCKRPPPPDRFTALVKLRIAKGRWFSREQRRLLEDVSRLANVC